MRTTTGVIALGLVAAIAAACSGGAASPLPHGRAAAAASAAPSESARGPVRGSVAGRRRLHAGHHGHQDRRHAHDRRRQPGLPAVLPAVRSGHPIRGSSATRRTASGSRAAPRGPSPATWASSATPSPGSRSPFNNAIQPGPKDFDIYLSQVSFSDERAQAVDLSDGYYDVNQAVVAREGHAPLQGHHDRRASRTSSSAPRSARRASTTINTIDRPDQGGQDLRHQRPRDRGAQERPDRRPRRRPADRRSSSPTCSSPRASIVGQFATPEGGEHFSVVLDKDSTLTECVNAAIGQLARLGRARAHPHRGARRSRRRARSSSPDASARR